jgi:hypothetical protein
LNDAIKCLEGFNGTAICLKGLNITVTYLNDSMKYLEGFERNCKNRGGLGKHYEYLENWKNSWNFHCHYGDSITA